MNRPDMAGVGADAGKGAGGAGNDARPLCLMLVAGEPSGDLLGGRLMIALRAERPGPVEFFGIGGAAMQAAGLESLFPLEDLAVMGLLEVLPRLPRLHRRLRQARDLALTRRPDALITIDAPGFNFRLSRRLEGAGFPLIHYVAPSVWAWRPGRAAEIARFLDHLLALLPFEPPWFERVGLPVTFVGHPVVESGAASADGAAFRAKAGIAPTAPLLALLPGSRRGEVARHLPPFGEALAILAQRLPGLAVVLPTLPELRPEIERATRGWAVVPRIVAAPGAENYAAMAAADAALAASGTVALELALARVPTIVAYRVNPLTARLARRLITVRYVSLVNIILDRPVMPELLQEDCVAPKLAAAVERLMIEPEARAVQLAAADQVALALGQGGPAPSHRAARAVLAAITAGPRRRAGWQQGEEK